MLLRERRVQTLPLEGLFHMLEVHPCKYHVISNVRLVRGSFAPPCRGDKEGMTFPCRHRVMSSEFYLTEFVIPLARGIREGDLSRDICVRFSLLKGGVPEGPNVGDPPPNGCRVR